MATTISNFFSESDILYINQLPDVLSSKLILDEYRTTGKVNFEIQLTASIRSSLEKNFGLNLSNKTTVPMRWIKGDTAVHIDIGSTTFENTYLVYLNNSPGELIIDNSQLYITKNTGYIFNDGLLHKTQNTEDVPRLLLGPMNEFANQVGAAVIYYDNYNDALLQNQNYIAYSTSYIVGSGLNYGSIGTYTTWRIANSSYLPTPQGVFNNGGDLSVYGNFTYWLYPSAPCFLEGTKILCNVEEVDKYIEVEKLRPGMLVKTSCNGYKKVELIGRGEIVNPANNERTENRLYKCSPINYRELTEDLYLTGCHSILVSTLTDTQLENSIARFGELFVTDKNYRLNAYLDEKAEPWNSEGTYTIYHFALENTDYYMNYGVFANGLLVETSSKRYMKELSNMTIIE